MTALAAAVLLSASGARPAAAQVITGRVVDSTSQQPISGTVVQALAADGTVRTRTLSDAVGRFALRVDPSVTQLRVQRIGFRPRLLPRPAAGDPPLEVRMQRLPGFLDPVRVIAAQCPRRGRSSPTGLIEQARAGLLASVVAREVNPAAVRRASFERRYTANGRRLASQQIRMDSAENSLTSFSAVRDAEGFVRRGFLEEGEGGQVYFAPDAETLLDDAFAAGYCFRVMPADRARPNQVGLGFEAANRRRGRVDVSGALWIDTVARELRDIEFRYEGLPPMLSARRPGGRIEFATLPTGISFVTRWQMDLVGIVLDSLPGRRAGAWVRTMTLIRTETGGELLQATWRDGTDWRGQQGTFLGQAKWADGTAAAGVLYALKGTPYRARSDSSGRVVIADLIPGTYSLLVVDERLLPLGLGIETGVELAVARDTLRLPLRGATVDDYVVSRCREFGKTPQVEGGTFLLARALWDDGTPIERATWSVRLNEAGAWTDAGSNGRTGSDGVMPLCENLVRGADIELDVIAPGGLRHVERRRLDEATTVVLVVFPRPARP